MVWVILVAWLLLAALAAFFMYCCSRVSNGAARAYEDDEFASEPPELDGADAYRTSLRRLAGAEDLDPDAPQQSTP